jgi:hypothetical protein
LTLPTSHRQTISPQALKRFRQKQKLLQKNYSIYSVSYTQQELSAGYFEDFYKNPQRTKPILNPELIIHPSYITISATVYLFSIPAPWPFETLLAKRFPVTDNRIALYTRITVENNVRVEDKKPMLLPRRILLGKKEIPSELLFLGRKMIPDLFTKGLSDPVGKVFLGEGEMVIYKAPAVE